MDPVERFLAWWSKRPTPLPRQHDRAQFTEQVMARVRALEPPSPGTAPARHPWRLWPRLALGAACAALLAVVVTGRVRSTVSPPEVAQRPAENLVLAQAADADVENWIHETLQLLEELEEEIPDEGSAGSGSDEQWLRELEWLDEGELSQPT
jgi:hypothetical protein